MKRKVYSQHKVRTSTQDRTLDSMFPLASKNTVSPLDVTMAEPPNTPSNSLRGREIKESECLLTSVKDLRRKVQKGKHRRELVFCTYFQGELTDCFQSELTEILEKHIFVGIVDLHRCLSLIQYSTKLYLVNHDALAYVLSFMTFLVSYGFTNTQ